MLPDILGRNVDKGIALLREYGLNSDDIVINEYSSPKMDIIGDDRRIIRVDTKLGKIILTVCNF